MNTEHRFQRRELGPPHEHDDWLCECDAWWYDGGCAVCGDPPKAREFDRHCSVWCNERFGGRCIDARRDVA